MRAKVYLCTLVAFALVVSGAVLVTENLAHASSGLASVAAAVSTCVTIQRGAFGEVADGYIWEASPETSSNTAYLYTGLAGSGEKRSLFRFGLDFLPDGAAVESATFGIEEISRGSGETITIYRITEPWSEGEPTWNNFANNYDDTVEWSSLVAAGGPDALTATVTGLVSAWAGGEEPNYGLLLMNSDGQAIDRYASSETGDVASRPWLEVCYIVNNDPLAVDDETTTDEDIPVDINVLDNDSDPDDDILTVSDYDDTSAEGGMVDCTSAGLCTYTPPTDFNGADTFAYTASDGYGGTDTATVTVTVNPINDPPVAVDDSATTDEDTPVTIVVTANDTDVDGTIDPATVTVLSEPSDVSVDPVSGDVTYSPDADYHGTYSFTYTVSDNDGATSNVATVTVTIADVQDPPVAVDDSAITDEDIPVDIDVLANDTDPDGDDLIVSDYDSSSTRGGTVNCTSAGLCTYTPPAGFNGADTFDYTASDGHGGTDTATVTVTVNPTNGPPVAVDDSATTDEGTPVDINVLANDTDPDGDDLIISDYDSSSTQGGTADCTSARLCTYTPPAGFNGADTFTYTASDGRGGTDTATVTVTVVALAPTGYRLYLPVVIAEPTVYRTYLPIIAGLYHPDLVVDHIIATSNSVEIIIKNQGNLALAPDYLSPFALRVDLYVAPDPVPTEVNQTWDDGRCTQGVVWLVTGESLMLAPGGTLTLTIGDAHYQPSLSNFPGSLSVGTPVYAQVDSAGPNTTYGAVPESHEVVTGGIYNNITGPVLSTPDVAAR